MSYSRDEVKQITDKVLNMCKADAVEVRGELLRDDGLHEELALLAPFTAVYSEPLLLWTPDGELDTGALEREPRASKCQASSRWRVDKQATPKFSTGAPSSSGASVAAAMRGVDSASVGTSTTRPSPSRSGRYRQTSSRTR